LSTLVEDAAGKTVTDTANSAPIRVAIIDDDASLRASVGCLIDLTDGFECRQQFGSMEDALSRLDGDGIDIVLLDLGLPGMSGTEGARVLKSRRPDLPILTITVYDDDDRIFDALCAGACGYILKDTPPDRLLAAIREAVDGGSPMSPTVARKVITLFRAAPPPERADYGLTPHEAKLLALLVDGHSYKSAAAALGVSVNTISFHMRHIYDKLQVHSKSAAVAKALRGKMVR
jgi:DNA-binding NarL/FixJ family response regulator